MDIEALPDQLLNIYNKLHISDCHEAIFTAIDALALELGFIAKDTKPLYIQTWKLEGKMQNTYFLKNSPNIFCTIVYVPMYSQSVTTGYMLNTSIYCTVSINTAKYICPTNFQDAGKVYKDFNELSKLLKNSLLLPLMAEIEYEANIPQSFGICKLQLDVKQEMIFKKLDVKDICSISLLNKDYYKICQNQLLWKYLFRRDYSKVKLEVSTSGADCDWRREYIKERAKSQPVVKRANFPPPELLGWYLPPHLNYPESRPDLFPHGYFRMNFNNFI